MAKPELPTIDTLRKLFRYDQETGKLFYKQRTPEQYAYSKNPERAARAFNSRCAEKEAGTLNKESGYLTVYVERRLFPAHRVAFAIHHGHWPKHVIDHINGNRADNRAENLRDVTNAENLRNRAYSPRGRSGEVGVYWNKRNKKWQARLYLKDRAPYFGDYDTVEEAAAVIAIARKALGFIDRK